MWIRLSKPGGTEISAKAGAAGRVAVQRWVLRHGLTSTDGTPFKIHRSRIRTTFQSLRNNSSWAGRGRATIDPNHSPQVEGDHYLTATTAAQRLVRPAAIGHTLRGSLQTASARATWLPLKPPLV